MPVASTYRLLICVEFPDLPLYDEDYRENCKAGCPAHKQLTSFLSPDGNISREESQNSTVPGIQTGMPVLYVWD